MILHSVSLEFSTFMCVEHDNVFGSEGLALYSSKHAQCRSFTTAVVLIRQN